MVFYFQMKLHKHRIYVDCDSDRGKKQAPNDLTTPRGDLDASQQGTRRTGSMVTAAGWGTRFFAKALIMFDFVTEWWAS